MTKKEEKRLLVRQAAKLIKLGIRVEQARNALKKLVDHGVRYDAPEMMEALQRFEQVNDERKRLEAEHLELRGRLGIE